jgi:TRAP transporter TAXI family solute receptor
VISIRAQNLKNTSSLLLLKTMRFGKYLSSTLSRGTWLLVSIIALGVPNMARAGSLEGDGFSDKLIVLGTGSKGGSFQPVGQSICDGVNRMRERTLVRCVAMPTAGSVFNLFAVENGAIQAGIAQEDLLAKQVKKTASEKGFNLRTLAVLHDSPVVVVVRQGLGIGKLQDLKGRAFNVGNQGSGQATIASALLEAAGLTPQDLARPATFPTSEVVQAFCEKQIDGMVEAVAHPSDLYRDLLRCGGEFLALDGEIERKLMAMNPFLKPMKIPEGTYREKPQEFNAVGMRNVLFARDDVNDVAIERLIRALDQQLPRLRSLNPMMQTMSRESVSALQSVSTPPHVGALRAWGPKSTP